VIFKSCEVVEIDRNPNNTRMETLISWIKTKLFSRKKTTPEQPVKEKKTYSIEEIRQTHSQAYIPWAKDEDEKLELLFCEGKTSKELAEIFQRNIGAINSRIKKLGLKEK
jgi:DNA-directed RNA polymerase specialized sigma24 family protein